MYIDSPFLDLDKTVIKKTRLHSYKNAKQNCQ